MEKKTRKMLPGELDRRLELYSEHAAGLHSQMSVPECDQCESSVVTLLEPKAMSSRETARDVLARLATLHSEQPE